MSFPADDKYKPRPPPESSREKRLTSKLIALLVITGMGMGLISSCVDKYSWERYNGEMRTTQRSSQWENNLYYPK